MEYILTFIFIKSFYTHKHTHTHTHVVYLKSFLIYMVELDNRTSKAKTGYKV